MRLYYLAFLCGIMVSCKFTLAFYMILPLLYVLIHNYKDIKTLKIYDYPFLIVIAILPLFVYMLDAILDTGSPVFPYYNSIFKSKYFGNYDWFDTDVYGARNILQVLIWPLYITIFPNRGYNLHQIDYNFLTGWIVSCGYVIYYLINTIIHKKMDKNDNKLKLALIIIYYNFILAKFCIGYIRYGSIIPLISGIFIIKLLVDAFENKRFFSTVLLAYVMCAATVLGCINYSKSGKLCYYTGLFTNSNEIINRIKINASCVLKDQDYYKYDIDGVWGVIGDDSGTPSMLNVDDRIIQLRGGVFSGESEESQKIYKNNILNNTIYVPIHELKYHTQIEHLDINKFELIELVDVIPNALFLLDARPIYIFKVEYNPSLEKSNAEKYYELLLNYNN